MLVKIQELALEIQAAHAVVDGAPAKIEEAETRFRERNAEYVAIKALMPSMPTVASNARAPSLERARHYQDGLMRVKTSASTAVLKGNRRSQASIGDHEAILASMDRSTP
jgi:hypothetical protein